jgi:hypothetical protein
LHGICGQADRHVDQNTKNILSSIIALASLMMLLVAMARLKARAVAAGKVMTGTYSLDGTGRRIAGCCSIVAAALAVLWLVQRLRGPVPRWGALMVDMFILYSSLGALGFGLVGIRRELGRRIVGAPLLCTMLCVIWSLSLALDSHFHGAPDLARAGLVTFAVIVGLGLLYGFVGKRLRPLSAQPAVAQDGASPL